ncbi:MAG: hypothetical protein F9K40_06940 [Kofleriaceae bacterium]|nr:MAG: hypothetical protein F9K40_06940 [Kofleriaceae bacterium]MBZ0238578.1 putative metal-binding motif-containing protein [Kofleriaceae bacterium]
MLRSLSLSFWGVAAAGLLSIAGACGGDDDTTLPPLFEPKPECEGQSISVLEGQHRQLISFLEIGDLADGFDLDGDGDPDNKLAGVGSLARDAILESLNEYDILIPLEMFDFATPGADSCVKFALYLGLYKEDADGDGEDTAVDGGDCNDHVMAIPGAEVADNRIDDDCDGLADELNDGPNQTASTDTGDMDMDGQSIMDGDCDDTNAMIKSGMAEICGDGYDNDCDGVADRTTDAQGVVTACNPYDDTPDTIRLDPRGFDTAGAPLIAFTSGEVTQEAGGLKLVAGPSLFQVSVPVTDGIELTLKITGTTVEADIEMAGDRVVAVNGRLGGVIDAHTADTIRGLDVPEISLTPENSLLDAVFANVLGPLLALPALPPSSPHAGCRTPDIDVDRDGLEAFCDKNLDGDPNTQVVDTCIDGDGTVIEDTPTMQCSEALDSNGKKRFVDGISVELNFSTAPADLVRE